jgi:hypothetical protein
MFLALHRLEEEGKELLSFGEGDTPLAPGEQEGRISGKILFRREVLIKFCFGVFFGD